MYLKKDTAFSAGDATAEAERRSIQFVVTTSVPSKGEAENWLLIETRGGDDERKEGGCPAEPLNLTLALM